MHDATQPAPLTVAIIGAGNRGANVYARWFSQLQPRVQIVAVAEPDPVRRELFAARHQLATEYVFTDWRELLSHGRLADALVIATPDQLHVEPAVAALELGYHLLLEKPIAPTAAGVRAIAAAAGRSSGSVTVAHVLRYGPFFSTIKRLLTEGEIGELVNIQHTENIGYWHFAHSYVRGNWRREDESSSMILAKACHDLDLLRWLVGRPCTSVASFGSLKHFRRENAPGGSTARCLDGCAVERNCPYSAVRFYLDGFDGQDRWPHNVVSPQPTSASLRQALETGPYGRCVYRSDNDVADNQVVALEFEEQVTATLTVTAFSADNTRTVHLQGTHGEIRGHLGDGLITLSDFRTGRQQRIEVTSDSRGHQVEDEALVRDFVARLSGQRTGPALTSLAASLESHELAFAAEESRRRGQVVQLP